MNNHLKNRQECFRCKYAMVWWYNSYVTCLKPSDDVKYSNNAEAVVWYYPLLFDPVWKTKGCKNYKKGWVKDYYAKIYKLYDEIQAQGLECFLYVEKLFRVYNLIRLVRDDIEYSSKEFLDKSRNSKHLRMLIALAVELKLFNGSILKKFVKEFFNEDVSLSHFSRVFKEVVWHKESERYEDALKLERQKSKMCNQSGNGVLGTIRKLYPNRNEIEVLSDIIWDMVNKVNEFSKWYSHLKTFTKASRWVYDKYNIYLSYYSVYRNYDKFKGKDKQAIMQELKKTYRR